MPSRHTWQLAALPTSVVAIAFLIWALPEDAIEARNILHHLNFVPLLMAGILFGWQLALGTTVFAFVVESVNVRRTLQVSSTLDALDLLVELALYGAAGIIAGYLSDRSKRQHSKLEQTAVELETVYRELSQNVDQMKKAERLYAAGQLSASLAHEIRNPLASISGAAGLLKRSGTNGKHAEECIEIISKESQRLNKLLTNFLEFARPRAPRLQPAEVDEVVQSVTALAGHANSNGIALRRNVPAGLPPIECDSEQLKQVLLNLVVNAMQATPNGGIVEIDAALQPDNRMVIAVRDEGIGVPAHQRERIFEPFFTTKENGSGLGLAISAKIVEQHGGLLLADENPRGGMTFRVELPLVQTLVRK